MNSRLRIVASSIYLLASIFAFAITTTSYSEGVTKDNTVRIVFVDSSVGIVDDWSFLYKYAKSDRKPPRGYMLAINSKKYSQDLHLVKRRGDRMPLAIEAEDIDRIVMRWKEDPKITGRTVRVEYVLMKRNGEKINMKHFGPDPDFLTDMKFLGLRHLYLSGKMMKNDKVEDYEINLGYSNWALFKNDKSAIPLKIIFP